MHIDITKLDTTKTYVGLEVGHGIIAGILQELCHKVYDYIPVYDIPSHAFALRYINNEWHVWENHLKWKGIKQYPLSEYELDAEKDNVAKVDIFQYDLDLNTMDYWLNNNPGYSALNLAEIAERRLVGLPLLDTKGWVCSQTVAAANFDICNKLNLKFEVIAPVDFLHYFTMKGK